MRRFLVLLFAFLAGCASTPSVTYHKITSTTQPDTLKKVSDSYYLNASVVVITPVESKDPKKDPSVTYTIASVPQEYPEYKVGIEATNTWLSTTNINITKPDNTERVGTIGTETKENAREMVKAVGGIVAKVATLAALTNPSDGSGPSCSKELTEAVTIDLSAALKNIGQGDVSKQLWSDPVTFMFKKEDDKSACVEIQFAPIPLDARASGTHPFDEKTSAYYYSACRNVIVKVKYPKGKIYPEGKVFSKSLKIADPNFIQSVHFPYKGGITMHSECGVSVKTDGTPDPLYGVGVLAEVLDQIQAVKKSEK
ncbi:hypothetical protein [Duganella sp. HH101]|uniref:hypothetical protein n=1 Tax=Duganella sp. HH101 TaxID=1781066 RepID=UPI000892CF99|nr:hypothetical protein [Duganella sp. HH101]OFA07017.1 hypothetical protein DUGA2_03490 [Duganella sp. HH101]